METISFKQNIIGSPLRGLRRLRIYALDACLSVSNASHNERDVRERVHNNISFVLVYQIQISIKLVKNNQNCSCESPVKKSSGQIR